MVTPPTNVVELLGVKEGDTVELDVQLPRRDLFGALRGIGPSRSQTARSTDDPLRDRLARVPGS
jgi:hypothetical protein